MQRAQTSLPQQHSSSSRGIRGSGNPRLEGTYNPSKSSSPGSALGLPPNRTCPENLQREVTRRHSNHIPEPTQLTPFDAEKQRLYSELPLELLPPSLRLSPATLWRKPISATCIRDLVLSVTIQICDRRWVTKWISELKASPSGSAPSLPQQTGVAPSLLLTKPRSICPSLAPTCHHSWTRNPDT